MGQKHWHGRSVGQLAGQGRCLRWAEGAEGDSRQRAGSICEQGVQAANGDSSFPLAQRAERPAHATSRRSVSGSRSHQHKVLAGWSVCRPICNDG